MRKLSLLIIFILICSLIFSGCSLGNFGSNLLAQDSVLSVTEVFDLVNFLPQNSHGVEDLQVIGYVLDTPTVANSDGKVSFTIVEDLYNPQNKLTVFSATNGATVSQYDKVIVKGNLQSYFGNSLTLMGKSLGDGHFGACEVTSVQKGNTKTLRNMSSVTTATSTVTVLQMATLLESKMEHYPLSDEFIERYQQNGGGYIDNAKKAGITVDRQRYEPNQKWHFFESWLSECLMENTISWEDDARSRIYSKLLCPELLLWIYEACGVDPVKVKSAMDVAVEGKVTGVSTSTIAKNMRGCVSWEDIAVNFQNRVDATTVMLDKNSFTLEVGKEDVVLCATVAPVDTTDLPLWTVVEGQEVITIVSSGNQATVHPVKEGNAIIKVSYNSNAFAECVVTVVDNRAPTIIGLPTELELNINQSQILTPTLNKGEGSFTFHSQDESVATVTSDGVVTGVTTGSTNIVVTCVDNPALTTVVRVTVSENTLIDGASVYTIVEDLGTGKRSKLLETVDAVFSALTLVEGNNVIQSIKAIEYIYGGGYGGSGNSAWYDGKMLKFGTTSVNGSVTFQLNSIVNYVKITGYVYDESCKIRVGDSLSTDWTGIVDNKTTVFTCAGVNEVGKDVVDAKETSTFTVYFEGATSVTIATTNKKPLFITSIEFGYDANVQ